MIATSLGWWRTVLVALIVMAFLPRLCLRVIARAWPATDPMRKALMAELAALPYRDRPFFVLEQLECALVDGVGSRRERRRARKTTAPKAVRLRGAGRTRIFVSTASDGRWLVETPATLAQRFADFDELLDFLANNQIDTGPLLKAISTLGSPTSH